MLYGSRDVNTGMEENFFLTSEIHQLADECEED